MALLFSETPGVQVRAAARDLRVDRTGEPAAEFLSTSACASCRLRSRHADRAGGRDLRALRWPRGSGSSCVTRSSPARRWPPRCSAENFDAAALGTLPAGWTSLHGGGANTVPWVTDNTSAGAATPRSTRTLNDNPGGDPTRFERLLSPEFAVPADADYVTRRLRCLHRHRGRSELQRACLRRPDVAH